MVSIEILKLSIALFLAWAFVYFCYRDYRLDQFRQDVFAIRDELFEYAASGNVEFTNPAYTILRGRTNQIIRYAHVLTMSRFMIVWTLRGRYSNSIKDPMTEWGEVVSKIESPEVRSKLEDFNDRVAVVIFRQLFKRSVFLFSFFLLISLTFRAFGSNRKAEEIVERDDIKRLELEVIQAEERDREALVTA